MAQNITLKDATTNEQLYPVTLIGNILDAEGQSLASLVSTTVSSLNAAVTSMEQEIAAYIGTPVIVKTETSGSFELLTNKFYSFGTMTSMTITLGTPTSDVTNEYGFEFDSGSSSATTLSIPSTVKWVGGTAPTISKSKHYEINIKYDQKTAKYYAIAAEF